MFIREFAEFPEPHAFEVPAKALKPTARSVGPHAHRSRPGNVGFVWKATKGIENGTSGVPESSKLAVQVFWGAEKNFGGPPATVQ